MHGRSKTGKITKTVLFSSNQALYRYTNYIGKRSVSCGRKASDPIPVTVTTGRVAELYLVLLNAKFSSSYCVAAYCLAILRLEDKMALYDKQAEIKPVFYYIKSRKCFLSRVWQIERQTNGVIDSCRDLLIRGDDFPFGLYQSIFEPIDISATGSCTSWNRPWMIHEDDGSVNDDPFRFTLSRINNPHGLFKCEVAFLNMRLPRPSGCM